MDKLKNILIVCASNKDRSPALEKYFKDVFPQHEYRSAGVNKYFCNKHGTHLITADDIVWSDLIVFCEDIHFNVVLSNFIGRVIDFSMFRPEGIVRYVVSKEEKKYMILNCGEYAQGCAGDDYITRAHEKLERAIYYGINKD